MGFPEKITTLSQWRSGRPIRRRLRAWNVLTMLAMAGLMLSLAALLIVIGLGETQIVASEGSSPNLFGNWWFDVGLFVAGVGMLIGAASIATIGSQGKARREFPDLSVEVILTGIELVEVPPGVKYPYTARRRQVGLRISNRELTRAASLDVRMKCDLKPGSYGEDEWKIPPTWQEAGESSPLPQVRLPIYVSPQTTIEGYVAFELGLIEQFLRQEPSIVVLDHNSGDGIRLPVESPPAEILG